MVSKLISRAKTALSRRAGMAMIVSMCILFVGTALSMSVLFTAASRVAAARKEAYAQQAYITATSVMDMVEDELFAGVEDPTDHNTICAYIKRNFQALYPYEGGDTRIITFDMLLDDDGFDTGEGGEAESEAGSVRLQFYRDGNEGAEPHEDEMVLTISATFNTESYTITRRYSMAEYNTEGTYSDWEGKWVRSGNG